ncbi:MAG TPA: patatin-like phospholipase family protein, partial [Fimbriimonas sp.]|nr:patatin-like phospholipase family protein [Fimbriimonas sp.]
PVSGISVQSGVRLISIDGGGVRGIIPATVLATWEKEAGGSIDTAADLFVGTSTGAIIASGLARGMTAAEVSEVFAAQVEKAFTGAGRSLGTKLLSYRGWALPAFSQGALRDVLTGIFGGQMLADCRKPISLLSFDLVTATPTIFRSKHHGKAATDIPISLVDAILASTAAPVLFPSAQVAGSTFVDGSLWAANPTLVGLLDARDLLGTADFSQIRMLSLGCGRPFWGGRLGFGQHRGLAGWGAPLVALTLSAQAEGIDSIARKLLPQQSYLRINPSLPKSLSALDNPGNVPELMVYATKTAREQLSEMNRILTES